MTPTLLARLSALTLALLAATAARAADSAHDAGGAGDGPPIDLTCIGTTVPAVVHVRCAVPRDAAGNPANPIDYRYEWDFGDPQSKFNELPGWNAAHVYDRPGPYTIRLTVRGQDGKETHRSIAVRLAPDERKKVYVSAEGNDALDGATPARAVRSVPRAFHLGKEDVWVLFRRGDVFDISASVHLYGRGLRVGNYPREGGQETPLPVFRKIPGPAQAPQQNESMFYHQPKADDTLVQGIEFDSVWDLKSDYGTKKIPARAFTVGGTNFAVRWCSFRNLTDGVNTEMKPTGVLLLENHFSQEIRGYCLYLNGQDQVVVGNVMTHSRQEHLIRASEPGVQRLLVAYNDLSRMNKMKGSVELRCASWFYVAGNYFRNGTMRVGPQEQDQTKSLAWRDIKCEWGVVQDNRLDDLFYNVRLGTYHVTFRNNVIRIPPAGGPPKPEDGNWGIIVESHKPGYDDVRKIVDVRIEHNTILNLAGRGHMLYVSGRPVSLIVRNNAYVTDGKPGSQADAIAFSNGLDGVELKDNVYPAGPAGRSFVAKTPIDRQAWAAKPQVKGDRFGPVPVDADDNVPIGLGAGAKLGNDRREREARAKANAPMPQQ